MDKGNKKEKEIEKVHSHPNRIGRGWTRKTGMEGEGVY